MACLHSVISAFSQEGCSLIPEENSARLISPPFPQGSAYTQLYIGCVICFCSLYYTPSAYPHFTLPLLLTPDRLKITCHSLPSCPSTIQTQGCGHELMLSISFLTPGIKGDCQNFRASSQGILHLCHHLAAHTLQDPASFREMGKEDRYAISQLQATAKLHGMEQLFSSQERG